MNTMSAESSRRSKRALEPFSDDRPEHRKKARLVSSDQLTQAHTSSTLLTLPTELRCLVYEAVFQHLAAPLRDPFATLPARCRFTELNDLFLACRQIYNEAFPLYRKEWQQKTTFYFDNITELYELKQRARGHPVLADARFYLRTIEPELPLGHLIMQFLAQQPGYHDPCAASPGPWWFRCKEKWAQMLASSQTAPSAELFDTRGIATEEHICSLQGSDTQCPQIRRSTWTLDNGCRIVAHSHNMPDADLTDQPQSARHDLRKWNGQLSIALEGSLTNVCTDFSETILGYPPSGFFGWSCAKVEFHHSRYWYCDLNECVRCNYGDYQSPETIDMWDVEIDTWAAYEKLAAFGSSDIEDSDVADEELSEDDASR